MKNVLITVILIVSVAITAAMGIRSFLYQRKRQGVDYYTKITPLSERKEKNDYFYKVKAFDKNGNACLLYTSIKSYAPIFRHSASVLSSVSEVRKITGISDHFFSL